MTLFLVTVAFSAWISGQGYYTRAVAVSVRQVSIPAVSALGSIEKERQLSLAALADPAASNHALRTQRATSDHELTVMRAATTSALSQAPASIKAGMSTLTGYLDRLPSIRGQIDAQAISAPAASDFYDQMLDAAYRLFVTQASIVPDSAVIPGALAGTEVFRVSDMMSRASSLAASAYASGTFTHDDFTQFSHLVGAYHSRLNDVLGELQPEVRATAHRDLNANAWHRLSAAEDALIANGPFSHGVPAGLAVDKTSWTDLTAIVSGELAALTKAQATEIAAQALSDGNNQLAEAAGISLAALALAVLAFLWALRQSSVLAGHTLVPRIRALGENAERVVRRDLPALLSRVARGESVDTQAALPQLGARVDASAADEQGMDELAQVAGVLNEALKAVVDAAVGESSARAGALRLFVGIAYRTQKPLRKVNQLLDRWEHSEQDSHRLQQFFDIHHGITQVRGITESLIILGGGQPGRRWPRPQPLHDVLRAAISHANDFPRIKLNQVPDTHIAAEHVAGFIQMITQLLNNAVTFSQGQVLVRGELVDTGVVVEVEDAGVGMTAEQFERFNALLREAPEIDVTTLADGSQLGLFVVAQLAKRMGMRVQLRTSPYGGVLAIVLIRQRALSASEGGGYALTAGEAIEVPARTASSERTAEPAAAPRRLPPAPVAASPTLGRPPRTGQVGPMSQAGRHSAQYDDHPPAPSGGARVDGPAVPAAGGGWSMPGPAPTVPSPQVAAPRPGRDPLPERQPQQHLAPQLRTEPVLPGRSGAEPEPVESDEVRHRYSAIQRGSRAGRRADNE